MAALTGPRNTIVMALAAIPTVLPAPVKGATIIQKGSLVGISAGLLVPYTAALGIAPAGRAEEKYDNSAGADGAITGEYRRGVFKWDNSGTDPVGAADLGNDCYGEDDHTVSKKDGNGARSRVGKIVQVDTDGVWVEMLGSGKDSKPVGVLSIPVKLKNIVNGQLVGAFTPGFAGRIKKAYVIVTDPATTAAKLATVQPRISGVATTGGAIALTSANCTPLGAVVAGTGITAANEFSATDTIDVQGSGVTAFAEGECVLHLVLA